MSDLSLEEENKILRGLLKGYWEDLDGTLEQRINSQTLGGKLRGVCVQFVNKPGTPSVHEAIQLALQKK